MNSSKIGRICTAELGRINRPGCRVWCVARCALKHCTYVSSVEDIRQQRRGRLVSPSERRLAPCSYVSGYKTLISSEYNVHCTILHLSCRQKGTPKGPPAPYQPTSTFHTAAKLLPTTPQRSKLHYMCRRLFSVYLVASTRNAAVGALLATQSAALSGCWPLCLKHTVRARDEGCTKSTCQGCTKNTRRV